MVNDLKLNVVASCENATKTPVEWPYEVWSQFGTLTTMQAFFDDNTVELPIATLSAVRIVGGMAQLYLIQRNSAQLQDIFNQIVTKPNLLSDVIVLLAYLDNEKLLNVFAKMSDEFIQSSTIDIVRKTFFGNKSIT